MAVSEEDKLIGELTSKEYEFGFTTNIESDKAPPGLNEDTIRLISAKKNEPEWLLEWRLDALRNWQKMTEPEWAHVVYNKPDFQAISYYSAPKKKTEYKSLDDIDPELRLTMQKLGISLEEQKRLSGVAVDFVMDSVSVATSFKDKLAELGIIFCSMSEAVQEHPQLVRKYLGTVVPKRDNFYAALNSAVFTDGSFCYIPKGVRCPMELSTYFRINESGNLRELWWWLIKVATLVISRVVPRRNATRINYTQPW
jgi:Fe-S cluster assembly protein SufB